MSWIAILGIVALVVLLPALSGIKPEGARPTARTRLMNVARVILLVAAIGLLLSTLLAGT